MNPSVPEKMKAAVIDRHGGPEVLEQRELPVPKPRAGQVLIRVESAGVGVWDADIRSGDFEFGKSGFPKVLGNDGAGTVVAVGKGVEQPQVGDRVYAYGQQGGFYAEYAVAKRSEVAPVPAGLPIEEAGALGADGVTALVGLEDKLKLRPGEDLVIFGASGGIGHLAVQLAKRMGARVLAVASGEDGVQLVRRLGADAAVDGHSGDVKAALQTFAPQGLDAALVLANDNSLNLVLLALKKGGRLAFPNGVEPAPEGPPGVKVTPYDGTPKPKVFERLNRWIGEGPFEVQLGQTFALQQAADAHRQLGHHHLGKLALRIPLHQERVSGA
jgi:NADPH:quinone reductase-like Zn-dependent oxidoreductase